MGVIPNWSGLLVTKVPLLAGRLWGMLSELVNNVTASS